MGIFQPAWDSLNDDLNTPEALGHVFSAIRKADIPSLSPEEAARLRNAFHFILAAFGIILPEEGQEEAPEEIRTLADQRWQAKQNRDWTEADRLRAEAAPFPRTAMPTLIYSLSPVERFLSCLTEKKERFTSTNPSSFPAAFSMPSGTGIRNRRKSWD